MFLIFDTETTGFFNKNLQLDDPKQARVCQLACVLFDDKFNTVAQLSTLIKPDKWTIEPGAEAVHGISLDKCKKYGVPMSVAMQLFNEFSFASDYRIAHNSKFDTQMLDVERAYLDSIFEDWQNVICTMETMTPICKLPNTKYPGKFKWPKLQEAYQYCFNKMFDKAHDALADVIACGAVFKWCVDNKKIIV